MNDYNFLVLTETLLDLYANGKIAIRETDYTAEFKSLIGQMQDAVSNVD